MILRYLNVLPNYSFCRYFSGPTIYALSSGYGKCGVAVIRVSGPQASLAAVKIGGLQLPLVPRHTFLRKLRDPLTNQILDKGLVIWFPGPHSFTSEDSCEFQVHGGPAVITAVLQALGQLHGFRPAEPGEFTKRAFHAGKLDLTEVEGLSDLINAETDAQRQQALSQMDGRLSSLYNRWKLVLKTAVAHIEAYIDFSEDENIEDDVLNKVEDAVKTCKEEIQNHLLDGRQGEILRSGVKAVIVGKPNVGKSSLLNEICQRPAAIVTSVAGTTRDIVETTINIGGYPVALADTAGLRRDCEDIVEQEGISRAHMHACAADLVLLVMDAVDLAEWTEQIQRTDIAAFANTYIKHLQLDGLLETCSNHGEEVVRMISTGGPPSQARKCVTIVNKCDLISHRPCARQVLEKHQGVIGLSCKTGQGFSQLLKKLKESLVGICGIPNRENPRLTQARHRHHLQECLQHLDQYTEVFSLGGDEDLLAHHLRKTLRSLGKITGHVSTEEILDVIFKDFCIGK